jgi:hypothetical protein
MSTCRLIVCEKASHFAPALRRELGHKRPSVIETRSLSSCKANLAESPESLVAIETTPDNFEAVVSFVGQIRQQYPQASVVALVNADTICFGALLAEAGAISIFSSVLEVTRLVQMARRKFALATQAELSAQEFVQERMPWPTYASLPTAGS